MPVFNSHTTEDDPVVKRIRQALQSLGIDVWVDSQELAGGDKLAPEIQNAIKEKTHFIAVLSPKTINSPWVKREIDYALGLDKKVIALMLPGIKSSALAFWLGSE